MQDVRRNIKLHCHAVQNKINTINSDQTLIYDAAYLIINLLFLSTVA